MALELIHEFMSDDGVRKAEVYKHSNNSGYTVKCFENSLAVVQEIIKSEQDAEDKGEDWVQRYADKQARDAAIQQEMTDLEEQDNATEGTPPPHLEV